MFEKVLIANRGAVARRVVRALDELGVRSVCVYSDADENCPYLEEAGEAYRIGGPKPVESYLNQEAILDVMAKSGADAVHPGYGFLAENAEFARRVEAAGAVFIGPSPEWIDAMGHKTRARKLMAQHGLPLGLGTDVLDGMDDFSREAQRLGYPVLVKAAAGGGGIGMMLAQDKDELVAAVKQCRTLAERAFDSSELYLEKLLTRPRHIEFQILADKAGSIRHLFERECSIQRRHQKVVEEAPAPGLERQEVNEIAAAVERALGAMGYDVIGTVETLRDDSGGYGFLETNTRLQVEHAVTEMVTGVDVVQSQVRLAAGEALDQVLPDPIELNGHALEVRVYAEDPVRFLPSPGPLEVFRPPRMDHVRVETGYAEGQRVTPFYDPMLAKVIVHGKDRDEALRRVGQALAVFEIKGVKTNIPAVQRLLAHEDFYEGRLHTGLLNEVI
jgi:acetyl-CoA carboxylase biotin carboxylase subunit